jgi:hypothetical protein
MAATIAALGDDIDELFDIMQPWGDAVRAGFGYLPSGPHDLASAASAS